MKGFLEFIIRFIYPKRCPYCARTIRSFEFVCDECEEKLPRITGKICSKCGREEKTECCCRKTEKYFDGLVAPFYYTGNVRRGLHTFKFRRSPDCAEEFAKEMSDTVRSRYGDINFDFITEVPSTSKSIKERGYNQCTLLAKKISNITGIEHKKDVIVKLYETEKQHGLTLLMRKGNLSGVFDVKNPSDVEGKTILLCDDISTSGETLNECSKMLWLYGAKEVYCVSLALTQKHIH